VHKLAVAQVGESQQQSNVLSEAPLIQCNVCVGVCLCVGKRNDADETLSRLQPTTAGDSCGGGDSILDFIDNNR